MLQQCLHLTELELGNCAMTREAAGPFADAFASLTRLSMLSLSSLILAQDQYPGLPPDHPTTLDLRVATDGDSLVHDRLSTLPALALLRVQVCGQ